MDGRIGRTGFLAVCWLLALITGPAAAQVGGPGGFARADAARAEEEGSTPEGRLRAIAAGEARLAALDAARDADPPAAGTADAVTFALRYAEAAWDLARVCDVAIGDDILDPRFPACVEQHRKAALEALAREEAAGDAVEGIDEILFYLGYYRLQAGDADGGDRSLARLVEKHSGSVWVPEALLLRGDRLFDAGDMKGALAAYDAIEAHPKSVSRPWARYKAAWCHLNLSDFRRAREVMAQVVEMTSPGGHWEHLRREVLKDYAFFYARDGDAGGALAAFEALDRDAARDMTERVAGVYVDEGRYRESITVLETLLGRWPDGDRAAAWRKHLDELRSLLPAPPPAPVE